MTRTGVKICGINDAACFDAVIEAGAAWIGFVFFPASPRYVSPAAARALSDRHHDAGQGGPARVGLFVDPTEDAIAATLDQVRLDVLQLYGRIPDIAALRARFGLPLWRAVGVDRAEDLPVDSRGADRLLIEAKPPAGATRPGGNAVSFDWRVLRGWQAPVPWILAGGLTPDNVAAAIGETGARAVDVSSGVERSKGVKDPALIRAFVRNARDAFARG